ncbi:MAG: nucleotidyl transferase AbiEii/AbiGii toxin family protein [Candidatus Gracilibacteria bacterium]
MLNREKHQLMMGRILKDIYSDISISPLLGFKGGICAYFFYGLPRFSVDLDFDLFVTDKNTQKQVFKKIGDILKKYGGIKDAYMKKFTIFFLLSYGDSDHNIKVEINTRGSVPDVRKQYELMKFLGISMMVSTRSYLFVGKLSALVSRKEIAMRDIYDVYYFLKNGWEIDPELINLRTGKTVKEYLKSCIELVEKVKDNQVLQGLGELLDKKEKLWIKKHLKEETVFLLKNYVSVVG